MKTLILLSSFIFLWGTNLSAQAELSSVPTPMNAMHWGENPSSLSENTITVTVSAFNAPEVPVLEGNIAAFVKADKRSQTDGAFMAENPALTIHVDRSDTVHFYIFDNADAEMKVYPAEEALVYNSDGTVSYMNYITGDFLQGSPYADVDNLPVLDLTKSDKPILIVESDGVVCPDAENATASLYIFGRGTSYTYNGFGVSPQWTNPNEGTTSTNNPITVDDLQPNMTHNITVTLDGDMASTVVKGVKIDVYDVPVLESSLDGYDCDGNNTLRIDIDGVMIDDIEIPEGVFEFTYLNIPINISATYGDNCMISEPLMVEPYMPLEITSTNSTSNACNGTVIIEVNATGGLDPNNITYNIDGGNFTTTNIFSVENDGDYNIIAKSGDCEASTTIQDIILPQNALLSLEKVVHPIECGDSTIITLSASGGPWQDYVYSIEKIEENNNFPIITTQSQEGSVSYSLSAGTYNVWVTSESPSQGMTCETNPEQFTINPAANPLTITNLNELNNIVIPCNGGNTNITVNVSGGSGDYEYKVGENGTYSSDNTFSLGSGSHIIYVKNDECEISDEINIGQTLQSLIVGIPTNLYIPCQGESIEVTFDPEGGTNEGYEYSISGGNFTSNNTFTLTAGNYNVVLRDDSGCETLPQDFTIDETSTTLSLELPANGTVEIPCHGGITEVALNADGGTGQGYIYTVTDIISVETTSQSNGDFELSAGEYQVNVRDNSGCTTTSQILNVNEPSEPLSIAIVVNNSCTGDASGSIDITVEGGSPIYSYTWSNGEVSEDVYSLGEGDYQVVVTDGRECSEVSELITIVSGEDLIVNSDVASATCSTVNDGSINLSPQNGTGPYTYDWTDDMLEGDSPSNLFPGTYSVNITDALGCSISRTYTVGGEPLPSPSITISPNILCPDEPVFIQAAVENISDAMFEWDYEGDISGDNNEVLYVQNINDIDSVTCIAKYNGCTSEFTEEIIPEQFPLPAIFQITQGSTDLDYNFTFGLDEGNPVCFYFDDYNENDTYYWEFGDGGWSVQAEPCYYFNIPGEYPVHMQVTTEDGCLFEFNQVKLVTVEELPEREQGIGTEDESVFAVVFPNPFIDQLTLMLETDTAGQWDVVLKNSLGQHINSMQVNTHEGLNQIRVDYTNQRLSNGLYTIQVSNGDKYQVLKIIKNAP